MISLHKGIGLILKSRPWSNYEAHYPYALTSFEDLTELATEETLVALAEYLLRSSTRSVTAAWVGQIRFSLMDGSRTSVLSLPAARATSLEVSQPTGEAATTCIND
jgi:hypothetical protein